MNPAPPPTYDRTPPPEAAERRWAPALESWGLSVALHVVLFLVFGLTWTTVVRPAGGGPEPLRTVEIVTRSNVNEPPSAQETQPDAAADTNPAAPAVDVQALLGGAAAAASPIDITAALPKPSESGGLGPGAVPNLTGGGLLSGVGPKTVPTGGRGRTSVYGLKGEGFKFVYVFDRSGSMGGSGNRALNAAKAELLRSLDELGDLHQFQIIFYNETPTIMQVAQSSSLMLATDPNKQVARAFVAGIVADGATAHEPALLLALRLAPDVIFFLTDADQPEISPGQMERIKKLNAGRTTINTIEFGLGPKIRAENFLDRLANENGGQSAYVDISRR